MALIYTILNQKGGVGKTTTTINLGAYLAYYGQRVLLVDADPQANTTACLGIDKNTVTSGTYEALLDADTAKDSVLHNARLKLSILPATQDLAGAEIELISELAREQRLKDALKNIQDLYDYILIDCPPSLGLLTLNGMVAAQNGLLIPVQCEFLALEGITQLTQTVERVRKSIFPKLKIRGVVLTMFDGRTNLSNDVVDEIQKFFPEETFDAIIPRSVRLAEAPSYGLPILAYQPSSPGAKAYDALAREILQEDGVTLAV
ncbi:MAG: ParA family protein [Chloroflexota bacterium]